MYDQLKTYGFYHKIWTPLNTINPTDNKLSTYTFSNVKILNQV